MNMEAIIENYPDAKILYVEGFEDAVLGVSEDFNSPPRVIYSVKKYLEIMMLQNEYDSEEALDDFMYNVSGGYMGETTPVWCWDNFE